MADSHTSFSYFSIASYSFHNDHITPLPPLNSTQLPIKPPPQSPTPLPLHLQSSATKIQSAYRSHRIRTLFKLISSVNSEATRIQLSIQRQETVDAIRTTHREKLSINEALMRLLLKLDSVPGFDPTLRDARRNLSRRIVGLQEILDAISVAKVDYNWDEMVAEIEEDVCRERGGDELERFCAQYLGFRCLQRFLSQP